MHLRTTCYWFIATCYWFIADSDEVYVAYKCTSLLEGSLSHPSDIVEASSLAVSVVGQSN